jgi:uncharacterized NAD(P)/FAD-binding protein YdhS
VEKIVIIGGGFSGTLLCVHLLRRTSATRPAQITLIEREPRRLARGFAYSTPHESCLLNVPAGRMSAFEDDRDHFVRFAMQRNRSIGGGTFVARGLYGDYLAALLADAQGAARHAKFEQISAEAVEIDDPPFAGQADVRLADGRRLDADRVVIALGNFPPCDPPGADARFLDSARYTRNPWGTEALDGVSTDGQVLLIGTGLTMLDVALVLSDMGLKSKIYAISRRGLLPQPHRASDRPPQMLPFPRSMRMSHPTPLRLLRALRKEIAEQSKNGVDWRDVVTSLRNDTPALWHSLDRRGRQQFLRHLVPLWDTHRHRSAPATARRIHQMRDSGQLIVKAARIERIELDAQRVAVTVKERHASGTHVLHVGHVVNCTGPDTNLARVGGALLRSALARGLIKPDELGLGLDVAPDGAVIRADGTMSHRLYTIGPLRRAQLWETTAVPELRVQAAELAARILE